MELHEKRIKATALVGEEMEMSFDFNDHADEAARKDYPNERDCEHGQLRRSCPLCAAEANYSALLARHNALVEAVAWEREFDEALVWLVQNGRYPRDMAGKYDLANERECARAEVDRLIADCKGEE